MVGGCFAASEPGQPALICGTMNYATYQKTGDQVLKKPSLIKSGLKPLQCAWFKAILQRRVRQIYSSSCWQGRHDQVISLEDNTFSHMAGRFFPLVWQSVTNMQEEKKSGSGQIIFYIMVDLHSCP